MEHQTSAPETAQIPQMPKSEPLDIGALHRLADAKGVSKTYWDYAGEQQQVSVRTIQAALRAMGYPADTNALLQESLRRLEDEPWLRVLPACTVTRQDYDYELKLHLIDGRKVWVEIHFEQGGYQVLQQVENWTPAREIEGVKYGEASFKIPANLPLGWHTLAAHVEGSLELVTAPCAITPAKAPFPELRGGRGWGAMTQFYSTLSKGSWGIGDAVDIATQARWVAGAGADFLLVNPVHCPQLLPPLENSPYLPSSRKYWNPIYIRPDAIEEVHLLDEEAKATLAALKAKAQASVSVPSEAQMQKLPEADPVFYQKPLLDRNVVWDAKIQALELIYAVGRSEARNQAYAEFKAREGKELSKFALWCALVERSGFPLPAPYHQIDAPEVRALIDDLAPRIEFYSWLQWIIFTQLQDADEEAKLAGMRIGIMHDLAVGIHPSGADPWANPSDFAMSMQVGAPPDMYNQLGQNWSQPPWLPSKLEESAYQPLRDVIKAAAQMGGALRIDHVMGLLRLWWIPVGAAASEGTYVSYNHEAMVGVLLLEAHRHGVALVGEDLGTVPSWARDYLAERGILGTGVFWFEFDDATHLRAPENYRVGQLAAANTHDMPPAAGFWQDEDLAIKEQLHLLDQSVSVAREQARQLRIIARKALVEHAGLDPKYLYEEEGQTAKGLDQAEVQALNEALYRYVAKTRASLVVVSIADAAGQRSTQNQPGTWVQYPNWRVPLRDDTDTLVHLETLQHSPSANRLLAEVERQITC